MAKKREKTMMINEIRELSSSMNNNNKSVVTAEFKEEYAENGTQVSGIHWLLLLSPRFSMADLMRVIQWFQLANEACQSQRFHWHLASEKGEVVLADNGLVLSALRDMRNAPVSAGVLRFPSADKNTPVRYLTLPADSATAWSDREFLLSHQENHLSEMMSRIILPCLSLSQSKKLQLLMPASANRDRLEQQDHRIERAIQLMKDNMEHPLSTQQLAEHAFLSVRHMERLFKRYFDQTPARYYTHLRLLSARKLLRYTQGSITDIALAYGFASLSNFCKLYRQHFGLTPGEERNRQNQNAE